MALRFQTRLTLAMSILIIVGVSAMTVLVQWRAASNITQNAYDNGANITQLATQNIDYGSSLPDKVLDRVGDQMLVSALLLSELIAVAENQAEMSPEAISAMLQRIIETSRSDDGNSPIDDIWVTDEQGRIYIGLEPADFTFSSDPKAQPQAHEFYPLLEPGAEPVNQRFRPRDEDGRGFKYVGVPGVDKPRIVVLGAGEHLLESINRDFSVQNIVERFSTSMDVDGVFVIDEAGTIVASAGRGLSDFPDASPDAVTDFARTFLLQSDAEFDFTFYGGDLGVMTRLSPRENEPKRGMLILFKIERVSDLISSTVTQIFWASVIAVLLAVMVIYLLSRSISKPIHALASGAEEFGRGNLEHRVRVNSGDEIGKLAEAFNGMAVSIQENMRTLELETRRRERLESELSIAADMQRALLPEAAPDVPGLELYGQCRPARHVGGDFYDFIDMGPGRLGIAIGDATGKGLSAALLTTQCWSTFRAFANVSESPGEVLRHTNELMIRQLGESGQFVTCFYMIVDMERGHLAYSVAGHNPPMLYGEDPRRRIKLRSELGLPLGVDRNCQFETCELALESRDMILLYSDGVTEARDANNLLYGERRLETMFAGLMTCAPSELVARVWNDVELHLAGTDFDDDMTVVGVRICAAGKTATA